MNDNNDDYKYHKYAKLIIYDECLSPDQYISHMSSAWQEHDCYAGIMRRLRNDDYVTLKLRDHTQSIE